MEAAHGGHNGNSRPSLLKSSDAACISLTVRIIRICLVERMGVIRESARSYLSYIVFHAFFYLLSDVDVHLRELRPEIAESEEIVDDEHLSVAIGSGPYADGGDGKHAVTFLAASLGTPSSTTAKAPASSTAFASSMSALRPRPFPAP